MNTNINNTLDINKNKIFIFKNSKLSEPGSRDTFSQGFKEIPHVVNRILSCPIISQKFIQKKMSLMIKKSQNKQFRVSSYSVSWILIKNGVLLLINERRLITCNTHINSHKRYKNFLSATFVLKNSQKKFDKTTNSLKRRKQIFIAFHFNVFPNRINHTLPLKKR